MEKRFNNFETAVIPEKKAELERPLLPIDEYRDQIIEQIRINPTSIVMGETGSGKTTEIPTFLLDEFPGKKIAITQPRRIATRSVSSYVASKRGVQLGEEIGYRMRFEDHSSEGTMANFVTDGILLQEIKSDPLLLSYDIVMVDEAHERSLNIDFLLGLLKKAQKERKEKGQKELKIIVTSATLEKEKFKEYFDDSGSIEVPGRTFDVKVESRDVGYDHKGNPDYTRSAANVVSEIVKSREVGDILIFMPRQAEILSTVEKIEELEIPNLEILPLYGLLSPEDQQKVFQKFGNKRKVIVATNIAETSITIDGIKFVIDSGLINEKDFNPDTGIESQEVRRHAKSGCTQRKGRAGRTSPGTCYRLYSEEDFNNRDNFQKPEIARSNLDHVVLTMKKIGISDVANFDFIDPPDKKAIKQAIDTLILLGALDEEENITEIGNQMSELPLKPELARMLIEAEKYGCTESICTIVAMIGEKSIFNRPKDFELEADMAREKFKNPDSDFLTLLDVWKKWEENNFSSWWAKNNFLNSRQLSEAFEVRKQLLYRLGKFRIPAINKPINENTSELIQKAVCAGMVKNLLSSGFGSRGYDKLSVSSEDSLDSFRDKIFVHPSSALFQNSPQYMIGANVVKTTKSFARLCQRVDEEWIPELAPQLLVKETDDQKTFYSTRDDLVKRTTSYHFKSDRYRKINSSETVTDKEEASKIFIEALINGDAYSEEISENNNKVRILKDLYNRSGGQVKVPDLRKIYAEKFKGITSNAQLLMVPDEEYIIDLDQYYSVELRREIEEKYPTSFMVRGRNIDIKYIYESAEDSEYSLEKYEAHIILPPYISTSNILNLEDIPNIGENGKPKIFFEILNYGYEPSKVYSRLEDALNSYNTTSTYGRTPYESSSYIPRQTRFFETNALEGLNTMKRRDEKKKETKKPEEIKTEKISKPEVFEISMTDELRERFNTQAGEEEFILETLREIINNVEYKNEKTEKLKAKLKELRKKVNAEIAEVKDNFMITVIKGILANISGEVKRIIKDFEKTGIFPAGWNDRYDLMMEKIKEVASKEGLGITKENLPIIRKKIAYLATKEISDDQIDGEIENIVVEMI